MFHEVRIYNAKRELKKTLSRQELSRRYWKKIFEQDRGLNPGPSQVRKLSSEMRQKLDAQMPSYLNH